MSSNEYERLSNLVTDLVILTPRCQPPARQTDEQMSPVVSISSRLRATRER